jgi:hypothetical protein
MEVTWSGRSALRSVTGSRVRTRSHYPQGCCRFGAEDRQPGQSRTLHSVMDRGFGFPYRLLVRVQTPRHAASAVGRARPVRGSCLVSELPTATPSTAVGTHWPLPRPSPTLGDHNPFQHYSEQELLPGGSAGIDARNEVRTLLAYLCMRPDRGTLSGSTPQRRCNTLAVDHHPSLGVRYLVLLLMTLHSSQR